MCVQTSGFAKDRSQIKQMSKFHSLQVVERGSETQLQVGEEIN